jgi:molybdate transport system substrate-binding protein
VSSSMACSGCRRPFVARRSLVGALAVGALELYGPVAIVPAHAQYPVAPDVVVFCEPTLKHALGDVAALWRSETGIPVRLFTSPTWAELEQIAHHARDDLVIGAAQETAGEAIARQLVKPGSIEYLWSNRLVVAQRAGALPTGVDLAALASKVPIALVDPGRALAGDDSKKALQALGLWDAVRAKSIGVIDTGDASYLLTHGRAQLAVVYATDVAADPALAVASELPAQGYEPIVYWAAEAAHALSPNVGKFRDYLRQKEVQARVKVDGLEVLP